MIEFEDQETSEESELFADCYHFLNDLLEVAGSAAVERRIASLLRRLELYVDFHTLH